MSYSAVAGVYHRLETWAFGERLQQARVAHLPALARALAAHASPRILLLGDGDGRFLQRLLECFPGARVDYVDLSESMMREAQSRLGGCDQVRWICGDLWEVERDDYDVVCGHFLLDCFDGSQQAGLVEHLLARVERGAGYCLVSDFDPSVSRWAAIRVWLMQRFFLVVAGVRATDFARGDCHFVRNGAEMLAEISWGKGWIYSVMWKI